MEDCHDTRKINACLVSKAAIGHLTTTTLNRNYLVPAQVSAP